MQSDSNVKQHINLDDVLIHIKKYLKALWTINRAKSLTGLKVDQNHHQSHQILFPTIWGTAGTLPACLSGAAGVGVGIYVQFPAQPNSWPGTLGGKPSLGAF